MERIGSFDKDRIEHIKNMRENFFRTGSTDHITGVRAEILACWETYYLLNQHSSKPIKSRVTDAELSAAKEKSRDLLEIAEPYMELLFNVLSSPDFYLTLMDNTGIVLRVLSSPEMLETVRATGLFEGAYRGINTYPGLLSSCLQLNKPFSIIATEHPASIDDSLAGVAAPIYEANSKRCLGVIGISGYWWHSHTHTQGLAIMTAEAISQQLELRKINATIEAHNRTLNTALEAVDSGTIYFRKDGTILAVNKRAISMCCPNMITKDAFLHCNIYSLFDEPICKEKIEEINKIIEQNGIFTCDLYPIQKYEPIHCSIRKLSEHHSEYFMQLQKRSELNKTAARIALPHKFFSFNDIVGRSAALQEAKDAALIAAQHDPSVLIIGDSGTGKELFAQAIHNSSPRSQGPFVAINCGAIPKSLIESELFGYEAGAFTGAQKNGQAGKFELANNGTIFLDEIGDMPYETQVALLRVLQTKEVVRIGSKFPIKVDVKIIAATNQNLEQRIAEHLFRQDLYYRLNVFCIHLPALKERSDDIPELCNFFINKYGHLFDKKISGITDDALSLLCQYNWPGNIRELENTIERAIIVCNGSSITSHDLPQHMQRIDNNLPSISALNMQNSSVFSFNQEASILQSIIQECDGNLSLASKKIGISRPTLYRKLKKYGMFPPTKQYGL